MSKETIVGLVKKGLSNIGIAIDLSDLEIYYDGLADEEFTSNGTAVYRCPVWYGGVDKATFSIYDIGKQLCISVRLYLDKSISVKDLFVNIA